MVEYLDSTPLQLHFNSDPFVTSGERVAGANLSNPVSARWSVNRLAGADPTGIASAAMKDHRLIDERSLALGSAIASRLEDHPSWIVRAQQTLERWLATADPRVRPALLEWEELLRGPVADVIVVLTGRDERSTRLRQSNPFAGVLPIQERNEILRRFALHESVST